MGKRVSREKLEQLKIARLKRHAAPATATAAGNGASAVDGDASAADSMSVANGAGAASATGIDASANGDDAPACTLDLAERQATATGVANAVADFAVASAVELYDAACDGDVTTIKKLLQHAPDVSATQALLALRCPLDGASALYVACESGQIEAARVLLEAGALPDQACDDGVTPLLRVCAEGVRLDIAKLLLDNGAKADQINRAGMTPLWDACRQGRVELASLLLDADANPLWKVQGWSTLHLARRDKHEELIKLLIMAEIAMRLQEEEHFCVLVLSHANVLPQQTKAHVFRRLSPPSIWRTEDMGDVFYVPFSTFEGRNHAEQEVREIAGVKAVGRRLLAPGAEGEGWGDGWRLLLLECSSALPAEQLRPEVLRLLVANVQQMQMSGQLDEARQVCEHFQTNGLSVDLQARRWSTSDGRAGYTEPFSIESEEGAEADGEPPANAPSAPIASPQVAQAPLPCDAHDSRAYRKPRGYAPKGQDGERCDWDGAWGGWRLKDGTWFAGNTQPVDPRRVAAATLEDAAMRTGGHTFGCSSALSVLGAAASFMSAGSSFASSGSGGASAFAASCLPAGDSSGGGLSGIAEPPPPAPSLMQRHKSTTVSVVCFPKVAPLPTSQGPRLPLSPIASAGNVALYPKPSGPVPKDDLGEKCAWDEWGGVWRASDDTVHEKGQTHRKPSRARASAFTSKASAAASAVCLPAARQNVFGSTTRPAFQRICTVVELETLTGQEQRRKHIEQQAASAIARAAVVGDRVDPSDFTAADAFQGARVGSVFRQGPLGLGYYRDLGEET